MKIEEINMEYLNVSIDNLTEEELLLRLKKNMHDMEKLKAFRDAYLENITLCMERLNTLSSDNDLPQKVYTQSPTFDPTEEQ